MLELEKYLLELPMVVKLKSIDNLPSRWQSYSTVYNHILAVIDQIRIMCPHDKVMLICAALHDVGKALTRKMKNGLVIFPGHADISKTLASPVVTEMADNKKISYSQMYETMFIIENHMRPAVGGLWTKSMVQKFLFKFDNQIDNKFNRLLQFSDLNIRGSNPQRIPSGVWVKEIQLLKDAIDKYHRGELV